MVTTVADILGQSRFSLEPADGSVSSGGESASGRDDGGDGRDSRVSRPDNGGDRSDAERATTVDPAAAAAPAADDGNGRRRARGRARNSDRPADGEPRARRARVEEDATINLDELLVTVHQILARVMAAPEFEISKDEAHLLSICFKRVSRLTIKKALSPMQEAVGTLVLAMAAVYGPRYFIYSARTGGPVVEAPSKKNQNGDARKTVQTVSVALGSA